jgi:hypothetical protein
MTQPQQRFLEEKFNEPFLELSKHTIVMAHDAMGNRIFVTFESNRAKTYVEHDHYTLPPVVAQ